jgi:excisionase family DNA binding protein
MARLGKKFTVVPNVSSALTLLSVAQTASSCGVDQDTVYRWLNEGKLKYLKLGEHTTRIRASELEKFLMSFEIASAK